LHIISFIKIPKFSERRSELNHFIIVLNTVFKILSKFMKQGSLIITLVLSANNIIEELSFDNVHGITDGKKISPITGLDRPRGFQEFKAPRFRDNGTGWW